MPGGLLKNYRIDALLFLRGGFNFNKLDILNKIIMTLFEWKLCFKKNKSPDEAGMLTAFSKSAHFTRKENIECLVDYDRSPGADDR